MFPFKTGLFVYQLFDTSSSKPFLQICVSDVSRYDEMSTIQYGCLQHYEIVQATGLSKMPMSVF